MNTTNIKIITPFLPFLFFLPSLLCPFVTFFTLFAFAVSNQPWSFSLSSGSETEPRPKTHVGVYIHGARNMSTGCSNVLFRLK